MKRIALIFTAAFILNLIWENLHSYLYESYMSGKITEFILARASLFDAILITIILLPFLYSPFFKKRIWLIILFGIMIAIINEWYGLGTGRWIYNSSMPILPIIKTGLTPTIQLGLLGYFLFKIQEHINRLTSF